MKSNTKFVRLVFAMAILSTLYLIIWQFSITFMYNTHKCNANNLSTNISAIFVFGDSTVDTGNNNYLPTIIKANYKPYGIDFPDEVPTGRFSDGKLVPDMIASMLGLGETVPPFLQPYLSDGELRKGACFASAASGLDDRTFAFLGQIHMSRQPDYFAAYVERLKTMVGEDEARRIASDALVIISVGNVDFLSNYYLTSGSRLVEDNYQNYLLNNLQIVIEKLYVMGCRKMIIGGLLPLGCMPLTKSLMSPLQRTCLENVNSDVQNYNAKLVKLLPRIEAILAGAQIVYADLYTPLMELIKNPQEHGFVEATRGCCGTGLVEYGQLCNAFSPVCNNPQSYVFWDAVHPSEGAYRYIMESIGKQLGWKI